MYVAELFEISPTCSFIAKTSFAFCLSKFIFISTSLVAFCVLSASFRTSSATTANPRPCSPALAASIAALRASKFVWSEMSLIKFTIVAISSTLLCNKPTFSCDLFDVVAICIIKSISFSLVEFRSFAFCAELIVFSEICFEVCKFWAVISLASFIPMLEPSNINIMSSLYRSLCTLISWIWARNCSFSAISVCFACLRSLIWLCVSGICPLLVVELLLKKPILNSLL